MNDNEMNKDNLQDPEIKENDSTDYRKSESLSLPVLAVVIATGAVIATIISILLVPWNTKKPQQTTDAVTEDSVSDEQIAATESVTTTPVPTDIPDISGQDEDKKIARNANEYLVYPESYEIDLKAFPEDFSDSDKDSLINAIGNYAYEEGFTVESAEYANELMSNTADGNKVFGMTLNGMNDFFVTTVWIPDADNAGEYLFIMDKRTMDAVRQESPVEEVVSNTHPQTSEDSSSAVTASPAPATATPTPVPTATPIPLPTSDYQPDMLEIRGVPGEIVDSFESVEEFRNSIYNFLYDHDIHVTVISADAYYEQYGENIYDFTLSASNRTIYARYDAGSNEYYYSFEKIS